MMDCMNIIKKFWSKRGVQWHVYEHYAANEFGFKLAIPTKEDDGRVRFTIVSYIKLDELNTNAKNEFLRKITDDLLPRLNIESHSWFIEQRVYFFNIKKIKGGFMRCRRQKYDFFYFFSGLPTNQVKFRVYKILGRLLISRAEGIVKSCKRKIGSEPYGYLREIVDFLTELGQKLYRTGIKNIIYKSKQRIQQTSKNSSEAIKQALSDVITFIKHYFGEEKARDVGLLLGIYNLDPG